MSAIATASVVNFCQYCGTQLQSNAKFCSKCGAAFSGTQSANTVAKPSLAVTKSEEDEITTLEQMVSEHPEDESYQKLLAVQLHDDAMKDWWKDPKDGRFLCTSARQIQHARKQLDRAEALRFNDPKLRADLGKMRQLVESMEKREYTGSWFHVIVLGFFYVVPGALWWYVNRRPAFLLNRDYIHYAETGKHQAALAKMGGAMEKLSNFFDQIFREWSFIPTLVAMIMLSPIFMILAFKQNYVDVKKEFEPS